MGEKQALNLFRSLPDHIRQEALDFMAFLAQKYQTDQSAADAVARRKAHFGHAKGQIRMSDDFDEPLYPPKSRRG